MVMIIKILIMMISGMIMMNDDDNQRLLTVLPGILVLYALQEIMVSQKLTHKDLVLDCLGIMT